MTVLLAAATVVLVLLGGTSVTQARHQAQSAKWVAHTHSVIEALQRIVSRIAEAESALRGYAIARDDLFLCEVDPAAKGAIEAVGQARELVRDNPEQLARLATLEGHVRARLKLITEREAALRLGSTANVPPNAHALSRKIAEGVEAMTSVERALLTARAYETDRATESTVRWSVLASSLACVLMVLTLTLLRRELNARRNAENHLSLLLRLGELLQTCRSLDEAFDVAQRLLPRFFPETSGSLAVVHPSKNEVETKCQWGLFQNRSTFSPDDCWALRRGQPHTNHDESGVICQHIDLASGEVAHCVPLVAHGELIGVMQIASPTRRQVLNSETVAEQISMALGNLRLREELKAQSIRDPLTGLFNRRYTEETLHRELSGAQRSQKPLGVVMIDVDHFKAVNDTHGHDGGDLVLKELAQVLRARTRGHDVASRLGGEELLVLLPGATLEATQAKAEALREAVSKLELAHRGKPIKVTASFGVAAFPQHGNAGADLLRSADEALYAAKRAGRDRVVTAGVEPFTNSL